MKLLRRPIMITARYKMPSLSNEDGIGDLRRKGGEGFGKKF